MPDAWRAYLELALGLTEASKKKAERVARNLVGAGGATAAQLQAMAEELVTTSAANRESLTKLVRFEIDRSLGVVGLATAEEVADLTTRVRDLERELVETRARAAAAEAGTGAAPDVLGVGQPDQAATGRSVAGPPAAGKAVAKKTVAKKTVAKKVAARKAVAPLFEPTSTDLTAEPPAAGTPADLTPADLAAMGPQTSGAPPKRAAAKKAAPVEAAPVKKAVAAKKIAGKKPTPPTGGTSA